jgi:hypothetical protein
MASRIPRLCNRKGCGALTVNGYCSARCKGVDTQHRNRQSDRLATYSPEWLRFVKYLRSLGNVICQSVDESGFRCRELVWGFHHIMPATSYPTLALTWRNVVGVCLPCHNIVEKTPDRSRFVPTLWREPMSDEPLPLMGVGAGNKVPLTVDLWTPMNRRELLMPSPIDGMGA